MSTDTFIADEFNMRDEICGLSIVNGEKQIDKALLDISMFVEAGAGAGKTYTIIQRIINQLLIGKKPGEIVVITFTNKAAEELRRRIAENLDKRAREETNEDKRALLNDALRHMDDMNISTIHSFCFKLLKQRCFDIKLPMDTMMLETEDLMELKNTLFNEWMATIPYDRWQRIINLYPGNITRSLVKKEIYGIFEKISSMPIEKTVHMNSALTNSANDSAKAIWNLLEVEIAKAVDAKYPGSNVSNFADVIAYNSLQKKTNQFLGATFAKIESELALTDPDYVSILRKFVTQKEGSANKDFIHDQKAGYLFYAAGTGRGKFTKPMEESDYSPIKDFINSNIDTINSILNDEICKYRNEIIICAEEARTYYRINKSLRTLSNDALLEFTRNMIVESEAAREYFAKKYTCYYVDEFQDTDKVQETFIWKLAAYPNDDTRLRPGALFVVGDPKQSIYRFRDAEPNIYLDVKARMDAMPNSEARVYELQINFRSNELIVKWVNDKFGATTGFAPIMVTRPGMPAYTYQPMINIKGFEDKIDTLKKLKENEYGITINPNDNTHPLAGVYIFRAPEEGGRGIRDDVVKDYSNRGPNPPKELDDAQSEEKQHIVDLILNLVNSEKYYITKYGEDGKPKLDKIDFKDIMLLTASKTRMNDYLNFLNLRGIPVQIAGETNPSDTLEVNAFVRVFAYIANLKDQAARVAAIEALRCLGIADTEADIEKRSIEILNLIYEKAKYMSAYGMANCILDNISMLIRKNRIVPKLEMQAFQTKIRQMIECVCKDNYGTPKDIALHFDNYLATTVDHELNLKPGSNVVQFMNVHKSKGLEGNIVILLDRRGLSSIEVSSFTATDSSGKQEYFPRAKMYPDARANEEAELRSERRRLEYVTATRAGQVFILMDYANGDVLFDGKVGMKEYDLCSSVPSISAAVFESVPHQIILNTNANNSYDLAKENKRIEDKTNGIHKNDLLPTCQRMSPSKLEAGKSKTLMQILGREQGENGRKKSDEYSKTLIRPVGNVLGSTLHRALDLLVQKYRMMSSLDGEKINKIIEACANQAMSEILTLTDSLDEEDVRSAESTETIDVENTPQNNIQEIYTKFLRAVLKSYYAWVKEKGIFDKKDIEIYTEFPFSFYEGDTVEAENQLMYANKHLVGDKKLKPAPVWMNGTADLLIVEPGKSIQIIDYKSDNDYLVKDFEFEIAMREKYIGQLENYRYAMAKLYKDIPEQNITLSVISFSQKDNDGNILPGEEIRIRRTEIV